MRHAGPALSCVLFLCACAAGPAGPAAPIPGFPFATASPDCAPWDGPAVTILFARDSTLPDSVRPPYLSVSLWKARDQLSGREWRWPGEENIGGASLCREDTCQAASGGTVWLDRTGPESPITGGLRLEFGDQPSLEGRFSARWRPRQAACG